MGSARGTLAAVVAAGLLGVASGAGEARPATLPPLPAERSRWVGEPPGPAALRGRVALVFVWTFG
jgi:hypothetical protein